MNILKHRFISPKADGTDASQIQPSSWNDGHTFTGGNLGDVLTRDTTDAVYGAAWSAGGTIARTDRANTFTATQSIEPISGDVAARLNLRDTTQPPNTRLFQIFNYQQTLNFAVMNDAETAIDAQLRLDRLGNVHIWKDLYEKQRATPIGHWENVPFNPADFGAPAGGSWAVTSCFFAYTLIGKTMHLVLGVSASTISGSPGHLSIKIPGGFLCGAYYHIASCFSQYGGTNRQSYVYSNPNTNTLFYHTDTLAPWPDGALTNNVSITLSIQ